MLIYGEIRVISILSSDGPSEAFRYGESQGFEEVVRNIQNVTDWDNDHWKNMLGRTGQQHDP